MGGPEDITLGEIYRNLEQLRRDTNERFNTLDRKVLGADLYTVAHAALVARVEDLERSEQQTRQWHRNLTLAVIGAIVTALASVPVSVILSLSHH